MAKLDVGAVIASRRISEGRFIDFAAMAKNPSAISDGTARVAILSSLPKSAFGVV